MACGGGLEHSGGGSGAFPLPPLLSPARPAPVTRPGCVESHGPCGEEGSRGRFWGGAWVGGCTPPPPPTGGAELLEALRKPFWSELVGAKGTRENWAQSLKGCPSLVQCTAEGAGQRQRRPPPQTCVLVQRPGRWVRRVPLALGKASGDVARPRRGRLTRSCGTISQKNGRNAGNGTNRQNCV